MWPISAKVFHKEYDCPPFIVALYYGDAKPLNVEDFLHDFVAEITVLISNGLKIDEKFFDVDLMAIIADSPARAFIKCVKGPTAFYGCERCTVKGNTVDRRRVYPKMNCVRRTRESFILQQQKEHHKDDKLTKKKMRTPLLDIPNFDPVMGLPIEIMHSLFLNQMKSLGEKWIGRHNNAFQLDTENLQKLTKILDSITPFIPDEFQRTCFDVTQFCRWKATQFAFFLLYIFNTEKIRKYN